jgi:predicted O-methyltransferase YrrM
MEFISKKIDQYVCEHTSPETELLSDLNRQTHIKILQPRMLSGHFQGRLLTMFVKMIQPKHILEIGTYTGYSALSFLEGLDDSAKITTIDCNIELEDFTRSFFEKSGKAHQIDYRLGDASEILPLIDPDYDFVFIDADKNNYLNYYEFVVEKMKSGGYIIADNVLWSGKVCDNSLNFDKDTLAIDEFNNFVQNDPRVENIMLPIRDGLTVIRKK